MWWVNNDEPKANLAQMNIMVRWSTTPNVSRNRDGSDHIETHTISEFVKVSEEV